jgi:hypothetical protein
MNEARTYEDIVVTEQYLDEEERTIMQAKVEVLNEAAIGVIIAAIIAALGALAAILVKLISMMKQGKGKVEENVKKVAREKSKEPETKNSSSSSSSNKQSSNSIHNSNNTKTASKKDTVSDEEKEASWKQHQEEQKRKAESEKKTAEAIHKMEKEREERNRKIEEERQRREEERKKQEEQERQVKIKKVISDYKKEVDETIDKVMRIFEKGSLSIYSSEDWYKKIEELSVDDIPKHSKYKGLSLDSITLNLKEDAIQTCIKLLEEAGKDAGSNMYNAIGKDVNSRDLKKASEGYEIFFDVPEIYNDPNRALEEIYNRKSNESFDFLAENYEVFLMCKIFEKAEKLQKKYTDDIKKFEVKLKEFKKQNNYNADSMSVYDEDEKVSSNAKARFVENMLHIEKNAVKNFTSFVSEWAELEQFRLKYVNSINSIMAKHARKAITEEIYQKYKRRYGEMMDSIEDPYPEYA